MKSRQTLLLKTCVRLDRHVVRMGCTRRADLSHLNEKGVGLLQLIALYAEPQAVDFELDALQDKLAPACLPLAAAEMPCRRRLSILLSTVCERRQEHELRPGIRGGWHLTGA